MGFEQEIQPNQIVCLEQDGTRLYAEVIQCIESRQICWVRPLMLAVSPSSGDLFLEPITLYDLRQGADLLWPSSLFRLALDTEVLEILPQLESIKTQSHSSQLGHQQLANFVRQVWQAQQSSFRF
jgi:hypothetical protein